MKIELNSGLFIVIATVLAGLALASILVAIVYQQIEINDIRNIKP